MRSSDTKPEGKDAFMKERNKRVEEEEEGR
jgi:hypothetical protein